MNELMAPLTSSLAAGPGHLVLTSFHSLCVSCFHGPSLLQYFSCVCLGFQMLQLLVILVTIWVSQDMGRWWWWEDNGKLLYWGKENSIYVFQAG